MSQITSLRIVYSTVYLDADQRNSPHKWPETRKMFPFDDVTMWGFIVCFVHGCIPGLSESSQRYVAKRVYLPAPAETLKVRNLKHTGFKLWNPNHIICPVCDESSFGLLWIVIIILSFISGFIWFVTLTHRGQFRRTGAHYADVTWHLKSLPTRLSVQPFVEASVKTTENLWWKSTGDR